MAGDAREIIELQLSSMQVHLEGLLQKIARRCAPVWSNEASLDAVLRLWIQRMPYCRLLYAVDPDNIQVSGNVYAKHVDETAKGQDLSQRPYFLTPVEEFTLSDAYISKISQRSCVTAVHAVVRGKQTVGYIAADFDLRDMPLLQTSSRQPNTFQRISGDPAIRSNKTVRLAKSLVDLHVEDVHTIINELVCDHGVFHFKLHYSSSRLTLWLMDDPYHYRIHVLEELINPALCMAYAQRVFPTSSVVSKGSIMRVLIRFHELRTRNIHEYLRAGSLNIMNGLVGLNFSSDDTVYLSASEFLNIPLDACYGHSDT